MQARTVSRALVSVSGFALASCLLAVTPANAAIAPCATGITADVKVFLSGPYDDATDLMSDGLRTGFVAGNPVLPTSEPYSGLGYLLRGGEGSTVVLGDTSMAGPASAPVDWVVVELRSASDPSVIVATDVTVVERDGTVVAPSFTVKPGSYYVAIRHRNHLGVMTANPVVFDGVTAPPIDFTDPATPLYVRTLNATGIQQTTVEGGTLLALWTGDADGNKQVKFDAPDDDPSELLSEVLNYPGNIAMVTIYDFAFGYFGGDVNMDGKSKYDAPDDDQNVIYFTVLNYPDNGTSATDYDFLFEQVPAPSTLAADTDPAYCTSAVAALPPTGGGATTPALVIGGTLLAAGLAVGVVAARTRRRADVG